jgi:uncharacterized protein (TIGR02145 family)
VDFAWQLKGERTMRNKLILLILFILAQAIISCSGGDDSGNPSNNSGGFEMFTDSRDGKTYNTIKVGNKTWMAENLNYASDGSWCYDNDESNCSKYGKLYDWGAAMQDCPFGWHLPSIQEWDDLAAAAGNNASKKLKSRSDWANNENGTDDFGFSALPGGYRFLQSSGGYIPTIIPVFHGIGDGSYWWASSGNSNAYYQPMFYINEYVNKDSYDKDYGYSVRCVKN